MRICDGGDGIIQAGVLPGWYHSLVITILKRVEFRNRETTRNVRWGMTENDDTTRQPRIDLVKRSISKGVGYR